MIVHCSSSTGLWGKQSVRGIIRCWFGILRCVPQIGLLSVNSCWSLHGSWGGDRIQNMLYVDPCTVVQFMAYFCVPKYVLCEYFSDIRTVSHSDLCPVSCVLLSVMLCMSRSLDRSALFPILLWKWKMLFRQWKDKENGREEFPRPGTQSGA